MQIATSKVSTGGMQRPSLCQGRLDRRHYNNKERVFLCCDAASLSGNYLPNPPTYFTIGCREVFSALVCKMVSLTCWCGCLVGYPSLPRPSDASSPLRGGRVRRSVVQCYRVLNELQTTSDLVLWGWRQRVSPGPVLPNVNGLRGMGWTEGR